MKLIYLANISVFGGWAHEIQITKMCEAFAGFEIGVELVVPKRRNEIKADPFDYYSIKRNFKITKLPCLDLCPGSDRSFYFWLRLISFLLAAKIYLFFKKFDILYTREQIVGLFFSKFILEIHTLPRVIKSFHKKIWRKADKLLVLTSFIKQRLMDFGINKDKILVSPSGVDLKKFAVNISKEEARKRLNLSEEKKLVGYTGMLRTMGIEKGIDTAIGAVKNLSKEILLVLVGGSQQDIDFYKEFARKLGIDDRIIFIGRVRHELVPLYLKAFDVLIAPFPENEHYNFYMSPLKIFEYMAASRPIIASDLPSIREILNKESALLVKPSDVKDLTQGIKKIFNDRIFSEKISQRALVDIKIYTWQKRAGNILSFINK